MNIEKLYAFAPRARVLENEPLARHTTFRVGGPADVLFLPESAQELQQAMELAREAGEDCLVIGNGHVGNYLAKILCGMGAHVTQTARSAGGLAHAAAYGCQPVELSRVAEVLPEQDIIFNSVPAPVLDEAALRAIRSDAWLIEIAAGKHGFDPELAGKLGVHFVIGQKLLGTFSPYTGGRAIAEAVVRMVREAQAQAE